MGTVEGSKKASASQTLHAQAHKKLIVPLKNDMTAVPGAGQKQGGVNKEAKNLEKMLAKANLMA